MSVHIAKMNLTPLYRHCIDWIQVNRMYVDTYLKYSSTLGRLMHVIYCTFTHYCIPVGTSFSLSVIYI